MYIFQTHIFSRIIMEPILNQCYKFMYVKGQARRKIISLKFLFQKCNTYETNNSTRYIDWFKINPGDN